MTFDYGYRSERVVTYSITCMDNKYSFLAKISCCHLQLQVTLPTLEIQPQVRPSCGPREGRIADPSTPREVAHPFA